MNWYDVTEQWHADANKGARSSLSGCRFSSCVLSDLCLKRCPRYQQQQLSWWIPLSRNVTALIKFPLPYTHTHTHTHNIISPTKFPLLPRHTHNKHTDTQTHTHTQTYTHTQIFGPGSESSQSLFWIWESVSWTKHLLSGLAAREGQLPEHTLGHRVSRQQI